jgi:hypothetical protein
MIKCNKKSQWSQQLKYTGNTYLVVCSFFIENILLSVIVLCRHCQNLLLRYNVSHQILSGINDIFKCQYLPSKFQILDTSLPLLVLVQYDGRIRYPMTR